jgi:hypothetical protein
LDRFFLASLASHCMGEVKLAVICTNNDKEDVDTVRVQCGKGKALKCSDPPNRYVVIPRKDNLLGHKHRYGESPYMIQATVTDVMDVLDMNIFESRTVAFPMLL